MFNDKKFLARLVTATFLSIITLSGILNASEVAIVKCGLDNSTDQGAYVLRTSISSTNVPIPLITSYSTTHPSCAPTMKILFDAQYQLIQSQVDASTGGSWYTFVKLP